MVQFVLRNVSWISIAKWNSLTKEQRRKFAPIDPDFVLELMSPSDVLSEVQNKTSDPASPSGARERARMREYINCGVRLGWLINPDAFQVEIYRQGKEREILDNPSILSGEDIMPGLVVDLSDIID